VFLVNSDRKVVYIFIHMESSKRIDRLGYPLVTFMFSSWYLNRLFVILTSFWAAILNSVPRIRRLVPSDVLGSFSERLNGVCHVLFYGYE